ncbi:bifunctional [glutamate--ammonia ligase]-adenylyl-L-tyrosine phosphorylase/[glutamate--ammonia-ligase] adenylyltransferase [Pseudomarimonas salicorniae]|uniref:Bifunctional glutamine synthetase adenylyltransferase/adenylyl-removing enzyme n=1 Tax=Pseudomarimonas salicorniae TaxID=2933270 RepID=A0ABT0GM35_9GAMM|nr:bifunctional [glutamate--ammonia ligase]-adenylyl-L-tyrosine phosphorylase/[glutamate--ammonia-ligase] adenylyltransferase [Lysobacter sp. CAU 1642]MCK7595092.1 bifunctional [glutamate--ammonia ligase]-adenylyl-L-tyrosine phosphorylase/[glutamate--ammonia-ligase] adenylyltransferase [Lysobacter sp. CAU 1642]
MSVSHGELCDWADARIAELEAVPPGWRHRLRRWLWASDYLFDQLRRHPDYFERLAAPPAALKLDPDTPDAWGAALRRFRHRHSLAQIAMDLDGAPVEQVFARTSWVARHCAQAALAAAAGEMAARHGATRRRDGQPQGLQVFALGKLGGIELNFSSDIDLVFAFAEGGQSDGPRPLDHDQYFQRLGQRLIQLLGEVGAEGFAYRVDMRLRPFGKAGRLALSANAMEQYYQRDGRDWERYAWIKARPLAGDVLAAEELLRTLRPFIYRRYLDYTAFEGLREMKSLIDAEVQRRDLAGHVKLGPGGIREIEFVVQLQQMIRGGREPALRTASLLPALDALQRSAHLQTEVAQRLRSAYRFLRRLENRLQMLRDEQVHELPEDAFSRARLALGLGFPDWAALSERLEAHRAVVREEFDRVFVARERRSGRSDSALRQYWQQIGGEASATALTQAGFERADTLHVLLDQLARHSAGGAMSARSRDRLDRLMPEVLTAAAASAHPDRTLERLVDLLQSVLRRPSYLALLDEQPAALQRLVQVMGRSALLAERVSQHPILLDDLLDARSGSGGIDPEHLRGELDAIRRRHAGDVEGTLQSFNELKQSLAFRLGLASLFRQAEAPQVAADLAQLAQALIETLLPLAIADLAPAHGVLPGRSEDAGLAVVGYGSLGGEELGFGSDLDLVFLYDADATGASDGPRPLESTRYQLRVVQKLLAMLSTLTAAGRLYEVDLRLRPDGAKGLLLTSLQSFALYQRERAWTWEHQALVRARPVAGARSVMRRFEAIRSEVLQRPRDAQALRRDVVSMRRRMRGELDRGRDGLFDLKQGEGGLVDLEFALQAAVLGQAGAHPDLVSRRATPTLIEALRRLDLLPAELSDALTLAHATLLQRALDCTLDARPRLVPDDAALDAPRAAIGQLWRRFGLGDPGDGGAI